MHINYPKEIQTNTYGRISLAILLLLLLTAVFANFISPYGPFEYSEGALSPPSLAHLLGTNDVGQDIFSRLIFGARNSLLVAFLVGLFSTLLGLLAGSVAALAGGSVDMVIMRIVDAFLAIPAIVIIILVSAYVQPSVVTLIVILSLLTWQGSARILRAQTLSLKQRLDILSARTFGAGTFYILRKRIVPDLTPVMLACFIANARRAVFLEAGLAFLGITDPSAISWGAIIHHALNFTHLPVWKWWLLPVGFALSLTIIAFTFLGHALEEAMNPRLRRNSNAYN
ncbi:MAG TPA: ABC transporter permease [Clostridia bacterium]|nr:ABC transporter permease [Clostridia bacterium]